MRIAIIIINTTVDILTLLVFIYSLLSFFLDRYHPIRRALAAVVEPMLAPIRKLIPSAGGFDFSPLILIVLLQVIGMILISILRGIG
jgi:YggT family protein